MPTRGASGASEKYELQSWAEKRSSLAARWGLRAFKSMGGLFGSKVSKQPTCSLLLLCRWCKTSEPKSSSWQLRARRTSISWISWDVSISWDISISWDVNMLAMGPQLRSSWDHQAINQNPYLNSDVSLFLLLWQRSEFIIFCRNDELIVSWPSLFKHVPKSVWSVGKTSQIPQI